MNKEIHIKCLYNPKDNESKNTKMNNTKINNKDFYQGALYNGTLLGAVWSIMYLLLFAATTSIPAMFLCMILFFASPFIAAKFAIRHRKKELDNTMTYMQAWIFMFYMYISATLLSALVSYIYFRFIDGGTFFITLNTILDESMKVAGTDGQLLQQVEQTKAIIDKTSTSDFVWQLMNNNLMNATIMPLVIALFVKKKN